MPRAQGEDLADRPAIRVARTRPRRRARSGAKYSAAVQREGGDEVEEEHEAVGDEQPDQERATAGEGIAEARRLAQGERAREEQQNDRER